MFRSIQASDLQIFRDIVGEQHVLSHAEEVESYTHDYTEDLVYHPEVVLRPANKEEIAAILRHCNTAQLPVTAAGARTGLSGGMLAVHGGVILATDRLNQVLEVDTANLQVRTQPGVITQVLMDTVAEQGLFYPVDPASKGSCFIGGNIAESSGGMRAVKYGTTRDYVLDLELVLPSGDIIRTGARTLKNATGYDLTRLIVGSEGTLGIVTEIVLKLIPPPSDRMLMLAPFASGAQACEAVSEIFRAGIIPSAMEFVEKEAIDYAQDFKGEHPFDTTGIEAQLIIEIDGNDREQIMALCEQTYEVLEQYEVGEILLADSGEEQERLWKIRRAIGEATRAGAMVKEEDVVVPRAALANIWKHIKKTAAENGIKAFCFGHAGDGNLHVHLPRDNQDPAGWEAKIKAVVREIFREVVALGGTLSGEHGIGLVQKDYMDIAFSPVQLELMKGIKRVFDPNGILNPGKVFP